MDFRPDLNTEVIGTYGLTNAKSLIEYTGIGAGQARDWKYSAAQLRFRHKRLFVQGFGNFSNAGTHLPAAGLGVPSRTARGSGRPSSSMDWTCLRGRRRCSMAPITSIRTRAPGGTINGSNEAMTTSRNWAVTSTA